MKVGIVARSMVTRRRRVVAMEVATAAAGSMATRRRMKEAMAVAGNMVTKSHPKVAMAAARSMATRRLKKVAMRAARNTATRSSRKVAMVATGNMATKTRRRVAMAAVAAAMAAGIHMTMKGVERKEVTALVAMTMKSLLLRRRVGGDWVIGLWTVYGDEESSSNGKACDGCHFSHFDG